MNFLPKVPKKLTDESVASTGVSALRLSSKGLCNGCLSYDFRALLCTASHSPMNIVILN